MQITVGTWGTSLSGCVWGKIRSKLKKLESFKKVKLEEARKFHLWGPCCGAQLLRSPPPLCWSPEEPPPPPLGAPPPPPPPPPPLLL